MFYDPGLKVYLVCIDLIYPNAPEVFIICLCTQTLILLPLNPEELMLWSDVTQRWNADVF